MCMPLYTNAKLPFPISPRRCHRFAIVTAVADEDVELLAGGGLADMLNKLAAAVVRYFRCYTCVFLAL